MVGQSACPERRGGGVDEPSLVKELCRRAHPLPHDEELGGAKIGELGALRYLGEIPYHVGKENAGLEVMLSK